jgi:Uma2 family endonuclease
MARVKPAEARVAESGTVSKLTYEDLEPLPEDGKRRELIDGELVVSPSPQTRHQAVVGNLHFLIARHVRDKRCGRLFLAPFDVVLSRHDVLEPDLLYISHERMERLTRRNVQGAPDLVVEVLSEWSRRRDEIVKRRLYEAHGVAEYWIVDPEIDVIRVYRRVDGRLSRVAELTAEAKDVLTTPLLAGLELSLADVFEEA